MRSVSIPIVDFLGARHTTRHDRRVAGHSGEPFRMVLRGLVCLDPEINRPIQITYSERYLESAEPLRPEFQCEVDAYFDSLSLKVPPS